MTDHERDTKHIVKEAVQEFLLALGVDVGSPAAVIELQKDFHHVRHSRLTMGAVGNKILMGLTGSAVTGVIAAITLYVTHR